MLLYEVAGFDWDDANFLKCQKHGVSIQEIEELFAGNPAVYADPAHSINEQRLRAIGKTEAGRDLLVLYIQNTRKHEIYSSGQLPVCAQERSRPL